MTSQEKVEDIKARLASAKDAYLAKAGEREAEWRPLSDAIKALQKDLSEAICEGAKDCPVSGTRPLGMMQPNPRAPGGVEYLIGSLADPKIQVRGGVRPHHTVELWNELVDAYGK